MTEAHEETFRIDHFQPCYLASSVGDTLTARVEQALKALSNCSMCPRDCAADRLNDDSHFCGIGRHAFVSSAFPHLGEEDCLRGWRGSGTIFFSSCNLRCVFCQNSDISHYSAGQELDAKAIAEVMLKLQELECHNINLVTPSQVVPQTVEALAVAINRGLNLPVVYNTSAYDSLTSLCQLDGLIDIYMPDFKFWESDTAERLCNAEDYPQRAREVIREMHRQVGDLQMKRDGLACRGLLVRHLVMPNQVSQSAAIMNWLATEISKDTFINIMPQYRPAHDVRGDARYAEINRPPTHDEVDQVYDAARSAGLWRFDQRTGFSI